MFIARQAFIERRKCASIAMAAKKTASFMQQPVFIAYSFEERFCE